jgi:hypothetical protein
VDISDQVMNPSTRRQLGCGHGKMEPGGAPQPASTAFIDRKETRRYTVRANRQRGGIGA